jgi:hypothetical protein
MLALSRIKTSPREKTLTGAGASFLHDHLQEGVGYNGR